MTTAKKTVAPVTKPVATAKSVAAVAAAPAEAFAKVEHDAVRDFLHTSSAELQRNHEKAWNFGREHAEQWAEQTEKTVRSLNETFSIGKDQFDALLESGKVVTELGKDLQETVVAEANELFSAGVELSKELLACRSLSELADVQSRALQVNLSHMLNVSAKLTDAWFKLATEVAEPVSAQASQVVTRLNKTLA